MSIPSEKQYQNQQQPLPVDRDRHITLNWRTVTQGIALFLLFWLIGPVIFPALLIQRWAAAPIWDARERWTSIKGSAFLSLLWYLPAILLHHQLTFLWTRVPALGEASFFPPTLTNMLFRWVMALPLAHLLVWILEVISPKTVWHPQRVPLPGEQALGTPAQSKDLKQTRRKTTKQGTYKRNSGQKTQHTTIPSQAPTAPGQTSPGSPAVAKPPSTPASESTPKEERDRWTLWEQLPEDHPWKQEAKREAARQAAAQQTKQPPVELKPSSQSEEYNWDEGEGSLKI